MRRSQAIEAELKERAERAERADAADSDTDTDELARKFAALRSGPSSAAASSSGHASPGPASGRASPEKSGTLYRSPERPTRPLVPVRQLPRPGSAGGSAGGSVGSVGSVGSAGSAGASAGGSAGSAGGTAGASVGGAARSAPGAPGSALGLSPGATAAPLPRAPTPTPPVPGGACLPVDELWALLFPGFDKHTDASGREVLSKRPGLRVLLVDVRPRPMYEAGHLRGADCVCIDPLQLATPPVTAAELEAALPADEAACFARRASYDLVVLYDEATRAFGAPGSRTPEQAYLDAVVRAVRPEIPHAPALLRGGYASWARAVGETGVVSARAARPPADALDAVRQSRVDGYRLPPAGSDVVSRPPRAYQGATSPRDLPASLVSGGGPRAPVRAGGESRSPPGGAPASYAAYGAVLTPPPPAAAAPAPGRVHRAPPSPAARTSPLPPAEREVRIGMSGLRNFGNTCYMNATLQCLSATVVLSRYMLDGTFSKAINVHNPLGTRGALAEAYAQLLRALWSQQFATLSPRTFREAIARFAPAFGTPDQQDSQEFLTFLLDGLHEDLNLVQQRPPAIELGEAQQAELERLPPQLASVAEWSMYRRRNDSIVVDAFQGQLRNQLRCLSCGHTSTTHNAFLSLSLPVAHGRGVSSTTLLQCLDLFVREEILEKSNAWNCPRCKKPRRATKRLSLSRLPPILVVHLKRFTYKGPATHKIDTPVHFPTTGLDLSNYMPPPLPPGTAVQGIPASESQRPPYVYDLYAATHHFGTLASGHYTASVKNQSTWFYCDDARITPDDPARLQSRSPYVLFFRRRPRSPS